MIKKIENYFKQELKIIYPNIDIENFKVEKTKNKIHGDYAVNAAMTLAKKLRKNPMNIANEIVNNIILPDYIETIEIAKPGFINLFLKKSLLYSTVKYIFNVKTDYCKKINTKNQNILIEFVSANPTGPLNIVSARAAAVGGTLVNIFNYCGYKCSSEFYVNDAGNQVELLAKSVYLRYKQLFFPETEFDSNCYQGTYINDIAIDFKNEHNDTYLNNFDIDFFKEFSINKILSQQKNSLKNYGVEFDNFFSEKKLRETKEIENVFQELKRKNVIYEKDGAVWFKSTNWNDDKDRVLIKNDKTYTYLLPDITYHINKIKRGNDKIIDILGPDHHGYIDRITAAMQAYGYEKDVLKIIILQQVNLFKNKQKIKMSKRAGELINLDDLISEVGKDAARYLFLKRSTSSHLDFDLDLAVKNTNDNPVYYVQYCHARISSIINKINIDNFNFDNIDLSVLTHPTEIELMNNLLDFNELLLSITETLEPHHLTTYVENLASAFHSFYSECRIIDQPENIKFPRFVLIKTIHYIIKICLELMGVNAPDKM